MKTIVSAIVLAAVTATSGFAQGGMSIDNYFTTTPYAAAQADAQEVFALKEAWTASGGNRNSSEFYDYDDFKREFKEQYFGIESGPMLVKGVHIFMREIAAGDVAEIVAAEAPQ